MKTLITTLFGCGLSATLLASQAADALTEELQRGVLAEEVNRDLPAAVQAYRAVITGHDEQSRVVATALYRLGECQRKLGQTNEAIAAYQRLLRDFPSESALARLSRENLAAFGIKPPATTTGPSSPPAANRLSAADADSLREEIKLIEQERLTARKRVENGKGTPDEVRRADLESLRLQRQLPENASRERQINLVQQEFKLAEQALEEVKAKIQVGAAAPLDEVPARRALLGLQRELRAAEALPDAAAMNVRPPTPDTAGVPANAEETVEIARLQILLRNSPDLLNAPGEKELTPLQSAANLGQLAVAEFLLKSGAEIGTGSGDPGGLTPLHYAAANGHKAVVELLLAHGADVNAGAGSQRPGLTPLHLALAGGHRAVVQVLLAAKADISVPVTSIRPSKGRPETGLTPLLIAVKSRSIPLTEGLLAAGAKVNQAGASGNTPLMTACENGPVALVQLLLRAKAEVNQSRPDGTTPLHMAVGSDQADIIALLLANGAKVDTTANEGYTPAHTAALSRSPRTMEALLQGHPDLNRLTQDGFTPLLLALGARNLQEGGQAEIVRLLLAGGANPDTTVKSTGETALHVAVRRNSAELCRVLLAAKPKLEIPTSHGLTPLQLITSQNAPPMELARLLLEAGANPNAIYWPTGDRSLHWAVGRGDDDTVALLLQYKADVNVMNNAGQSPLSMVSTRPQQPAMEERQARIITLLKQAGADELFHLRDAISVRRPNGRLEIVFRREGSEINRFTLLETIAMLYGTDAARSANIRRGWEFPDFARVTLDRRSQKGQPSRLDVSAILESGDRSRDLLLEWGDVLEIPEADHPVDADWTGLSHAALQTLGQAVTRRVTIVAKGETKMLNLILTNGPSRPGSSVISFPIFDPSRDAFWLRGAVLASRLVRTSSDLTRVTVRRKDPKSGTEQTWLCNAEGGATGLPGIPGAVLPPRPLPGAIGGAIPLQQPAPLDPRVAAAPGSASPLANEPGTASAKTPLWMQDGDVIEIPDKPGVEEKTPGQASVRVLGEVKSAGMLALDPAKPMDIVDAIATCGGFTASANPRRLKLTRDGETRTLSFDEVKQAKEPNDRLLLRSGDLLEIPRSVL